MDDPDRTTPIRVVAKPAGATPSGVHRLPPPPAGTFRGRATVAAVAAGAVVAGGQTLASAFIDPSETASAMLPVASVSEDVEPDAAALAVDAIGGDQLLPNTLAIRNLDAESQLDVQALAKATDIGQELARTASLIDAALAEGASEAHLFGDNVFVRPVLGRLTSMFGARWGTAHRGIDIANSIGTPIYALTDGVVEEAGPATGFGLWVVLRHTDGTQSVYGHVNRMFVKVGQKVKAGEQIAEVGNRGYSTGPHLHLEIWSEDGQKINPIPWLKRHGIAF
ncbi:M23 family metallopeptidase [Pseudonocardia sp. TRM90224]|uniref:M23 family metallopeptidase n=1 Tax=Pseudonocardia sp. TRM90224 TaxID=2812678 RepID=UPI001E59C411|nr:M23 family metallopeptidase [Pseudonocardia sp. TRM90224]